MYLHLGQSVVVPQGDVIGIFDLEITSQARITRDFLNRAQKEGLVESGDIIVITAGVPLGRTGSTNLVKAQIVDENNM